MDAIKGKAKKGNLIIKTWERCKSIGSGGRKSSPGRDRALKLKSRSWPRIDTMPEKSEKLGKKGRVAPEGCFSVYVGPQKQRFVVKTEYANHPLFKMLLEEAESEFGYHSQGPLLLPCDVDVFYKVLMEMDDAGSTRQIHHRGCSGFAKRHGSYHLLSPSHMVAVNPF